MGSMVGPGNPREILRIDWCNTQEAHQRIRRTEEPLQPATKPTETDALTIACIGIVAYILANVVHEGLGHGGACLITGGRPLLITAVNMDCSADNRLVIAGGSLMNAAAAGLFFLVGRNVRRTSPHLKYFAWLSMTVNLLDAAGYLAFSGIGGFGDWAMFIQGFSPKWAWRMGLSIVGVGAYVLSARWRLSNCARWWEAARSVICRPASVPAALSCRRDRRVSGGCVQSTRMVSGRDVRCRPRIRREVGPYLGAGMAQGKQPSQGCGRDACSHSKELGVDRCGHRHRRLLYFGARPGRTLRVALAAGQKTTYMRGSGCARRLPKEPLRRGLP